MNIQLSQVHIQNLRSIEEANVFVHPFTVLFGKNDSGKSNFLYALRLAFGNAGINEKDVFCSADTPYSKGKSVVIDLKFIPVDNDGKQTDTFNEPWTLKLGENIAIDADDNNYFAFRTEYYYDTEKEEYIRERVVINKWQGNDITTDKPLSYNVLSLFEFTYLDAQRDMALDIRDKTSMWSKEISKLKISPKSKTEIETSLGELSDRIVAESPFLQQVSEDLVTATSLKNATVKIDPVTRNVDELYKGLDIFISQADSSDIPISNLGLGTRSRAVFASYKSIINKRWEDAKEVPYFGIIAFEEPESHIHPHSQRELVKTFSEIQGQGIITTHSPYILTTSKLSDLFYVSIDNARSHFLPLSNLELQPEELRHIQRYVLNTRGELLFSNVVVLSEGETEEQALPVFFKRYFDCEPYERGVSFVGVGGKNYLPFLRMLEAIGVSWFIFSDGEQSAINELQAKIKQLYDLSDKPDLSEYNSIIVLDNADDFETYLLNSGYADEIISAINGCNYKEYEKEPFFERYIKQHHNEPMKRRSTDDICNTCGQNIWEKPLRDYSTDEGRKQAIIDCMKGEKTKYAVPISEMICSTCDGERKYPPKIKELLEQIKTVLGG